MSDQILVIGARGNVGHPLVDLLTAEGVSLKAATRHPEAYDGPDGTLPVGFDYDDPSTWDAALDGATCVFAPPKNSDPVPHEALIPFFDQAQDAGVEHVVLRPNWFMQNFAPGFMQDMVRAGTLYLPTDDAKSSLIDTRDVAAVAAKTLTEDGHVGRGYTLTGPDAVSYAEAMRVLSEVTGRTITYVPIPDEAYREALAEQGWAPVQIAFTSALFVAVRQGWAAPVTSTVPDLLGRPAITLRQYAEDYADAWT